MDKIKFKKCLKEAQELFKIANGEDINKDEFLLASLLYINKNE